MVDVAQVKVVGFAISGVVAGLMRQHKGAIPPNVPASVKGYFEREPGAVDLYPLADYLTVLDLLLQVVAPKEQRIAACEALGAFAGKRDAGVPAGPGEPPRVQNPNFRVSFDRMQGLPVVVRRALIMRERYYNRGYYRVKRIRSHELEIELHEFPPSQELCATSTGYLRELFQFANVGADFRRLSCRGAGESSCRWQLAFQPHIDTTSLAAFG